jgi:uncharacterized membrane protein YeiH
MTLSVFEFLDFFGVAVFAISGALTASYKKLDIFGVLVVAIITCLGGGTVRDLLIGAHPIVWIENTYYLWVGCAAATTTFIVVKYYRMPMRVLEVCDAIGLAFFTVAGIKKAQVLGFTPEISLIMGVFTGVVGGIMRDVLCNDIPLVFHKEIYASAAIGGGLVFLLLQLAGIADGLSIALGMTAILTLRIAAIFMGLSLPRFLFSNNKP